MSRGRWGERVLPAAAIAVFAGTCGAPLLALALEMAGASWSSLDDVRLWMLLAKSVSLAAATTTVSVAIGVPLGIAAARNRVRGVGTALLLHAFPLFVPPFVIGLGWFHWLGRSGLVGSEASSRLLFSPLGLVLIQGITFAPVVTLLTLLGVRGVDPALEDAGRASAGARRVLAGIVLPLAAPAMALAAILVFTLALGELGLPMFLRVPTYPAAVFARLGGAVYAPGEAVALAAPLVVIAAILLAVERRAAGWRALLLVGSARARPERAASTAATVAMWIAAAVAVTPLAALAWKAAEGRFSLVWAQARASAVTSATVALVAAAVVVAAGFVVGHALARRKVLGDVLDALAWGAFLVPGPALGVGLIGAWNHGPTSAVYGSWWILVVGGAARWMTLGVRPAAVVIAQRSVGLEHAAAVAGAGPLRRLFGLLLPLHARAVATIWLGVTVFLLRDLDAAVSYYPPGHDPLVVRIFTLEANGQPSLVAGLACVQVLVSAAIVTAAAALLRGVGRR